MEKDSLHSWLSSRAIETKRWEGRQLKNDGFIGTVAEHSFLCEKLANMIGELPQEISIALLFHDLCELLYGDISVHAVNQARLNLCRLIAKRLNILNQKNKEGFVNSLAISIAKRDSFKEFICKYENITEEVYKLFNSIGILRGDNFFDIIFEIKELQDKIGALFIRNIIISAKNDKKADFILNALNFTENPLVTFIEKIETSTTYLLKNKSDFICNLFGKTELEIVTSFEKRVKYTLSPLKRCLELEPEYYGGEDRKFEILKKFFTIEYFMIKKLYEEHKKIKYTNIDELEKIRDKIFEELRSVYAEKYGAFAVDETHKELVIKTMEDFIEFKTHLSIEDSHSSFKSSMRKTFSYEFFSNFDVEYFNSTKLNCGYFLRLKEFINGQIEISSQADKGEFLQILKPLVKIKNVELDELSLDTLGAWFNNCEVESQDYEKKIEKKYLKHTTKDLIRSI